ncbi:ATP-binding protein [Actinomadura nitritigenes]|uniref:ATP-binding protein n=1 Tax=Actinomadura nitritigenes TaxID=134602 RepID=UPI003D8D887E
MTDDGAGGARPVVRSEPDGESGRGLHIVAALAKAWGHRPDGPGTTVWAEFPADRGSGDRAAAAGPRPLT